ncbi:MAG: sialate O-acetylesterase [Candidatus Aminicenantes bacterium]|nr:sialate O-acetylesterase [Candidatus Aminicenantes bacterium]
MPSLKHIFFLVLALIAFVSLSCHETPEHEQTFYPYWHQKASLFELLPDLDSEIVFLGDSLTDGCNWSEMLQDPRVVNRGISGDTTYGVLARLDEVVESKPMKVFLMIGINDLATGTQAKEVVYNIKQIVKAMHKKSPDTEIILQSLLPVNKDFDFFKNHTSKTEHIIRINRALENFARTNEITYLNLHPLFATKENKLHPDFTNDGLHLNGSGYLRWKKAVEKHIN